jgi:SRSO17 transposase
MNELSGFQEQFADCFQRSESREHFLKYMAGQFSDLERKSIEPIALAVTDGNVWALQRFVSDAPWYEENMIRKYRSLFSEDLGSPDGALIFDETGFVKKGQTQSALPGHTAEPSLKSIIAKSASWPPMFPSMDTPWWTSSR